MSRILKRLALAGAAGAVAIVGVAISTPLPSEAELRELLRAAEGRPVPPPRVFTGDASACPVLNPAGGGSSNSAAVLQSLARAAAGADGGGGGTLLGYDRGRPVYADAAEEAERELAQLRWQEDAAKRRGARPPPEAALRKAELKLRLKELKQQRKAS